MGGKHATRIVGALAMAVVATISTACNDGTTDTGTTDGTDASTEEEVAAPDPVPGGKLVYAIDAETESWNAALAQWSPSSWLVASSIFDPLVVLDEQGEWAPFLAESVTPNDDYTVWTIKARAGVTFHNGEPFDADAMIANFEAQAASPLLGAVMAPIIETTKVDELTVDLTMANSWVHFPYTLVGQPGVMMAPGMIADPDNASHPIGTGPFVLDEWRPDDRLNVIKNDDYWLAEPYLNEIEFRPLPDVRARLSSLETGDVQALLLSGAPDALADPPAETVVHQGESTEENEAFLLINQGRKPFDDPRVRQALIMATDKQTIIDTVAGGLYEPADGVWSESSPWFVETEYPQYDREAARALIEEVEAETGPIELTITGPPWPVILEGSQLLQEQWQEVGIDVELETFEFATYVASVVSGNYDVGWFRFHGAAHPDGEFVFLHSQYAKPAGELSLNFGHIVDEDIDDALLEGRYTDDDARLQELYGTVQEELADNMPYIFLWHVKEPIMTHESVHDIDVLELPDGGAGMGIMQARHRFHQIWLES